LGTLTTKPGNLAVYPLRYGMHSVFHLWSRCQVRR